MGRAKQHWQDMLDKEQEEKKMKKRNKNGLLNN